MKYTLDDLFNNLEKDDMELAHSKDRIRKAKDRIRKEAHQFMEIEGLFEIVLTSEEYGGLRLVTMDTERMMVIICRDALEGRTKGKRIAEKYQFQIVEIS